jgi:hypothetical protein
MRSRQAHALEASGQEPFFEVYAREIVPRFEDANGARKRERPHDARVHARAA